MQKRFDTVSGCNFAFISVAHAVNGSILESASAVGFVLASVFCTKRSADIVES